MPMGPYPSRPWFGAHYGNGMQPVPQNNYAIASLIFGLLGLVPLWVGLVFCIAAIICGIVALQQSTRHPAQPGRGLAIAGLVLGLVFFVPASCGL
jgi:hypothetical protein